MEYAYLKRSLKGTESYIQSRAVEAPTKCTHEHFITSKIGTNLKKKWKKK